MTYPWIFGALSHNEMNESIDDHMREQGFNPDSKADQIKFINQSNRQAIEAGQRDSKQHLTYFDLNTMEHYPDPSKTMRFFGFRPVDLSNDRVGEIGTDVSKQSVKAG